MIDLKRYYHWTTFVGVGGALLLVFLLSYLSVVTYESLRNAALFSAAAHGDADSIRHAIDNHLDLVQSLQDKQGRTLLHVAADAGELEIVGLLAEYIDPNVRDTSDHTALWMALTNNHQDVAGCLLENGATYTGLETADYSGWWEGTTSQGEDIQLHITDHGSKVSIMTTCLPSGANTAKYALKFDKVNCVVWKDTFLVQYAGAYRFKSAGGASGEDSAGKPGEAHFQLSGTFSSRDAISGIIVTKRESEQPFKLSWEAFYQNDRSR